MSVWIPSRAALRTNNPLGGAPEREPFHSWLWSRQLNDTWIPRFQCALPASLFILARQAREIGGVESSDEIIIRSWDVRSGSLQQPLSKNCAKIKMPLLKGILQMKLELLRGCEAAPFPDR